MRWAQRHGYGEVGPSLYGVLAPPGFWAFLIFEDRLQPGGDLLLGGTMNQFHPSGPVQGLLFSDYPLPVFPHHRKLVFPPNAFLQQANKRMAVPWLLERETVKTGLTINQPGFNAVNRGGDHD